jgi:O-antigen/teichoic acid export membrane protein
MNLKDFSGKQLSVGFLKKYFSGQSRRGKSVIKNVSLGFAAKAISIIIAFLQIPVTLSILDKTEYGVWVTIFSVTSWLSFFDIGMGNGLRNRLTEALAENDIIKARKLVSTAYVSLSTMFCIVILVFIPIAFFVPWTTVFKAPPELRSQLFLTVLICVISTGLNFVFGLIHVVLAAYHQTGKSNILLLLGQLGILVVLYFISFHKISNAFLIVASVLSVVPLILNIGLNVYFFRGPFSNLSPSHRQYERKYLRNLVTLGAMFFVIQISAVIIYSTDNLIITWLYGPEQVVTYSLVFRYFSIVQIVFAIIMTPLWTMYVDAYQKKDMRWLSDSINNLVKLLYIFIGCIIIMIIASPLFFKVWIGNSFDPPLDICLAVSSYIALLAWGNIWVLPLNAAGKIKVQMIVSVLQALLNLPIIFLFNVFLPNLLSVVIGNIVCVLFGSGYMYFYYRKHFYHNVLLQNSQ